MPGRVLSGPSRSPIEWLCHVIILHRLPGKPDDNPREGMRLITGQGPRKLQAASPGTLALRRCGEARVRDRQREKKEKQRRRDGERKSEIRRGKEGEGSE